MLTVFARSSINPRSLARRLMAWAAAALAGMILFAGPVAAQTFTATSVTPSTFSGAGQTLTFSVTVNSGNRQVTGATAASAIGVSYVCAVPPGGGNNTNITFTCSGTYVTTLSDVGAQQVFDVPTVTIDSAGVPISLTANPIFANYVAPASPPTVSSISPTSGSTSGGTSVVITGTNLSGATSVTFGATSAGFTVNSATQITAIAPSGSNTVDVRVATPAGTSATSAADQFTYLAPPAVTSISPASGPAAGSTAVTINGSNFSGTTAVTFGATAASGFTVNSASQITATSPPGTGTVDVRVTGAGGTSATSAADQFTYISAVAPAVTTNPSNQTVNAGGTATFTVAASGTPTPTVQWQVDSGSGFANIAGATSTTLSFTAAGSQSGNAYRAVFTNTAGSANTTAATLTVNTAPSVTTNPASQTVTIGATATFTASASGSPTPTVQWQVDSGSGFTNIAGATSTTLSFTVTPAQSNYAYRAVFTNTAGSATTAAAILTVSLAPQTITVTSPAPASAMVGGATYTPSATASSGLAVAITIDPSAGSVCAIAGGTVSFQTVGTCVVNFNQAGDSTYQAAPQVQQSFAVGQGSNVITFPPLADTPFTSTPPSPAASASSGLAVSYASTTTGVCTATSGGAISFVTGGTCTITASQAGNANYAAATPVSQSFAVTPGVNTITFAPLPSRAIASGSFALAATASSGLAVSYASTTAATCSVSGSTVMLLGVGTCSITASQAGNGTYAAAAPVSQSFAITKAVSTTTLTSSAATVFFGQPVTLTATVGGVSPTGTVTFKDGTTTLGTVSLTGTTASFSSTTLSAGAHSLTATYNGDASNDVSTSSAVSVTVNARPDPSADPDVRASTDQQFRQTQRFVRGQIDNIGGRLDQLHSEGDNRGGMAVRISQVRPQLASALPFGGVPAQALNGTGAMPGAAMDGGAAQPVGTVAAGAAAASAAGTMQDEAPRWSIWASGDISFGKQQPSGQVETRFTSQGLTVGMDGRFSDSLKLGAAFGFGWDNSRFGTNGSQNDTTNASLAFYGSWRAAPQFYIDGIVGLGYGNINTTRYSTTGAVFLDGQRRTSQTFAAVIATWEGRIGTIEFAPYLRADGIWIHLSPYSETGSTTWALAFQAADENSFSGVAGTRLRIPLNRSGSWKLVGKAEYRTRLSGDYTQLLGYADLQGVQGSPYAITGAGVDSSTFTGGLGIEGRLRQATIRLNYDLTTMAGGNIANRFSGALIVPF
ncbi:autotransporter domain-containing protein [Novosphingobium sp.]|uniref:autotransporter domain-containing protein n=1 Tax=Novosphingobium sp. TaxID=1874826 RepID=UPI00286B4042|nr:autotransporter domain-containing protein [Novosphingobium sp.]